MRPLGSYLAFIVISSITSTVLAAPLLDGLYSVAGRDQEKGEYQGQVQIKGSEIIRIVKFKDYTFWGNQVETVWDGHIQGSEIDFTLKPTETLTTFNDFQLSAEQLKNPTRLHQEIKLNQPIHFLNSEESWKLISSDPGAQPLWKSERSRISAKGNQANWLVKLAKFFGIQKVINLYQDMGRQSQWGNRPEFINKQNWAIVDPTDFNFYQSNKNVVRLTNKTINPVSLAEATQRKNAYGQTLSEKARYFESETKAYNLNPVGMLEAALVDKNRNKIQSLADYDSTLWTGVYVWTQALRYKQTGNPEAYENMKSALKGLITLTKITNNPEQFARTLLVSPATERAQRPGMVQGEGPYANLKWQQIGNNDMSKGLLIAFTAAFSTLKSEDSLLRADIADTTKRMLQFEPIKNSDFNLGVTYGLVALYHHDKEALKLFARYTHNIKNLISDMLNLDSGVYYESIADWSGIHLSMISTVSEILISQELQKSFSYEEGGYLAEYTLHQAENCLYEMSQTYQNAHRNFLTIMTYALSPEARTSEFRDQAQKALWTLREFPAPRNIGYGVADHTINPDWSISAWPLRPWKALAGPFKLKKEGLQFKELVQGAYMYPFFETTAWQSMYAWIDNPFSIASHGAQNTVYFSPDYLLIYRMAVQSGLITQQD